jgi:hypothetical protein
MGVVQVSMTKSVSIDKHSFWALITLDVTGYNLQLNMPSLKRF